MIKKTIVLIVFTGLFLGACNKFKGIINALPEIDRQFITEVKYILSK